MFLAALVSLYHRLVKDPASGITPLGFAQKHLMFLVEITKEGKFLRLRDLRTKESPSGQIFMLPRDKKRGSNKLPFLLWDNPKYIFGLPEDNPKSTAKHQEFLDLLAKLPDSMQQCSGVSAMRKFYEGGGIEQVKKDGAWKDFLEVAEHPNKSCWMSFVLEGETAPVPCMPEVQEYVRLQSMGEEDGVKDSQVLEPGRCLVCGEVAPIVRIHGSISLVAGKKSGLVTNQQGCGYDSHGRVQGENSPVCVACEFAYNAALEYLVKSNKNCFKVGGRKGDQGVWVLSWSAKEDKFSQWASLFLDKPFGEEESSPLMEMFKSVWRGEYEVPDEDTLHHVMAIIPTGSNTRIAVKVFLVESVSRIASKFMMHWEDLSLETIRESKALPLNTLLLSIYPSNDPKDPFNNVRRGVVSDVLNSIYMGEPYPAGMLQRAISRFFEQADYENPWDFLRKEYPRVAFIKAFLNRSLRFKKDSKDEDKELTMGLDLNNTNPGYLLGRLFALFEKVQQEYHDNNAAGVKRILNRTVKGRFFQKASSTPAMVFGSRVFGLNSAHMDRLRRVNPGLHNIRKREIEAIMEHFDGELPASLSLEDRSRFAVGYYHQNHVLWSPKKKEGDSGNGETAEQTAEVSAA